MNSRDLDRILPPGGALGTRLFSRIVNAPSDESVLASGTLIDGWRIDGLLGHGEDAAIYLAERADGQFEQKAALKIVHARHGPTEHFRRERQILADLRHPAIAQLIDGGQLSDGRLWFATEPVLGERIDHYVRGRKLPLADRLALFDAACEAVAYAHSRLLVHRDIKPDNLVVDDLGKPRLLNFGIAGPGERERATSPGSASPEQRDGSAITTASDIYQLGLLLRALTLPDGEPCATLPTPMRRAVRRELAAIVAHATETEPARRYPTVAAMRADIAALRQRKPVSVIDGARYRTARFLERHAAAAAIAVVAASGVLSTGWIAAHRVQIERDQARLAAERAQATGDFLTGLFAVSDPGENRGESLTANQILARGASQLGDRSLRDPEQTAVVALEIARVYLELGEFRKARDVLTTAVDLAKADLVADAPEHVRLFAQRGRASYLLGDYDAARADFARAHAALASVERGETRDEVEAGLDTEEAHLTRRLGDLDLALAQQKRAIVLLEGSRTADIYARGLAWHNMGLILQGRGEHAQAAAAFERALALYRDHYGEDHPRTYGESSNLAEVLILEGNGERAEPLLEDNIRRYRSLYDGPSIQLSDGLYLLAQIRLAQGRPEDALALAKEAAEGYERVLGHEHNYRAFALVEVGNAELAMGNGRAALNALNEALRLRRAAFGDGHRSVADTWSALGAAHFRLGDLRAASDAWREAVTAYERALPATGRAPLARARTSLAEALAAENRLDEARAELARARGELARAGGGTPADLDRLETLEARLAAQ